MLCCRNRQHRGGKGGLRGNRLCLKSSYDEACLPLWAAVWQESLPQLTPNVTESEQQGREDGAPSFQNIPRQQFVLDSRLHFFVASCFDLEKSVNCY